MLLSHYMLQRVRASYAEVALVCMVSSGPAWNKCPPLRSAAPALAITHLSCSLLFNSDMPSEYNRWDTNISYVLEENVHILQQKQTLFWVFSHLKNQTMFILSVSSCYSFHQLICVHLQYFPLQSKEYLQQTFPICAKE